ncbi:O-antigen ligase family protein [Pseudomonadota bacterium]
MDLISKTWLTVTVVTSIALITLRVLDCIETTSIWRRDSYFRHTGFILLLGVSIFTFKADSVPSISWLSSITFLYIGLVQLSVLWSDDHRLCIKFSIQHTIIALTAFTITTQLSTPQCALLFITVCSTHLIIALWEDLSTGAIKRNGYRFSGRGLPFVQALSAILIAYCITYLKQLGYVHNSTFVVVTIIAILLFLATRTISALIAAAFSLTVWFSLSHWDWPQSGFYLVLFWVLVFAVGIFLYQKKSTRSLLYIALSLGRKPASHSNANLLSGRNIIWRYAFRGIIKRPLLGYGYGVFWAPRRVKEFSVHMSVQRSGCTAHSIYLDSVLNTGLIGLVVYVALLTIAFANGVVAPVPERQLFAALIAFVAIGGISDSYFIIPGYEAFCLYLILFSLAR